jgi:predicted TIM-barrel fold metal-dependent hydrolase
MYRGDAEGILETADRLGTRTTVLMSWAGPLGAETAANEVVRRATLRYPGKTLGAVYVNPAHLSGEAMLAELRLRVDGQGFVALKPYHNLGVPYDDGLWEPVWEFGSRRGLYVLMHTMPAAGGFDVVPRLAEKYPRLDFVVAHSGSSWKLARQVASAMRGRRNVWAELTYTTVTNGSIEYLCREGDEDRVLYGTDAPMRDARPQFGWVVWSRLPETTRRKILGMNFARLLEKVRTAKER